MLIHEYVIDCYSNKSIYTCKMLGYFESYEKAKIAIKEYLALPGFKNYPNNFKIKKIEVDRIERNFQHRKLEDKIEVFFRNHGNIKELNEYLTVAKVRMDSQTCNMLTLFFDYYLETILFNPKVDLNTFAGFHLNYQKHRFEDLILNHYTDMLFLYFDSGDFLVCFDSLVYDCERIKKSVMQTFKNVM